MMEHIGYLYAIYLILFGCAAIFVDYLFPKAYYVLKPMPLVGIIIYVLLYSFYIPKYNILTAACGLCLLGDVALLFERRIFSYIGTLFFLLAHIMFILFFGRVTEVNLPMMVFLIVAAIIACIIAAEIMRKTQDDIKIILPAMLYMTTEIIMVLTAISYDINVKQGMMISAGAILFFLSDAFLAWSTLRPFKISKIMVLAPYYSAVSMIVWGITH